MKILLVVALAVCITSCRILSFHGSPMYGTNSYVTQPMNSDSIKSAVYNNASLNLNVTNINLQDQVYYFQDNIYCAKQMNWFSAYGGVGLTLGSYLVNPIHGWTDKNLDTVKLNHLARNYFFGGAGFTGGIGFTIPMKGGEWRILGAELSLQNEFGDYASFREKLNKDSLTGLVTSKLFSSMGISTELVVKSKNKVVSGWKMSYHFSLSKQYQRNAFQYPNDYTASQYLSNTFHVTEKRLTTYIQINGGSRLFSFHFGVNYQLLPGRRS